MVNTYISFFMKDDIAAFAAQVAETLKNERKARKLSHEKLAALSGLSRRAIGKIESGERIPTIVTIYRLLKAMDISLEEFSKSIDDAH